MENGKKAALAEAIKQIKKEYGASSIVRIDDMADLKVEFIPTGSVSLDKVLGCGGLPRGRIVELYGEESCGKSSLALFLVAQVQKAGGTAVWIDAEHSFDSTYSSKIGVDISTLYVAQPDTGEEGLGIVSKMASSGAVDLIVVDSVAALVPKKELEGEIGDDHMALAARMMSQGMRMITGTVCKSKTVVIFINQVREKVGIYWGNKNTTTGGKALKFYASIRLEIKKGKSIVKDDQVIGNHVAICAVKNKVGFPFKIAEMDLIYERGLDLTADLLDVAVNLGIIQRAGAYYSFEKENIGQGREDSIKKLEETPELFKKVREEVMKCEGGLLFKTGGKKKESEE